MARQNIEAELYQYDTLVFGRIIEFNPRLLDTNKTYLYQNSLQIPGDTKAETLMKSVKISVSRNNRSSIEFTDRGITLHITKYDNVFTMNFKSAKNAKAYAEELKAGIEHINNNYHDSNVYHGKAELNQII